MQLKICRTFFTVFLELCWWLFWYTTRLFSISKRLILLIDTFCFSCLIFALTVVLNISKWSFPAVNSFYNLFTYRASNLSHTYFFSDETENDWPVFSPLCLRIFCAILDCDEMIQSFNSMQGAMVRFYYFFSSIFYSVSLIKLSTKLIYAPWTVHQSQKPPDIHFYSIVPLLQ